MTDAAVEFADLMPHRISVVSLGSENNYGKTTYDEATRRDYICLIEDEEVVARTLEGVSISVHLTAYCTAIPLEHTEAWPIKDTDQIEVLVPANTYPIRPLVSVSLYYDETGNAYSQVVRLT